MTTYNVTGVDDTGATDVTAALLAFFATCADGTIGSPNTILFPPGKTYRIDGIFALANRNHLIIDFGGSLFTTASSDGGLSASAARNRSHWRLTTCTSVRVTNGVLIGPHVLAGLTDEGYVAALEAQHAFDIRGSFDCQIDNWDVSKVYGDFIYIGVSSGSTRSVGVLFDECTFNGCGRQAMGLVACDDVEIRYCSFTECRRTFIDIEPNGVLNGCDGVWIHHCSFGTNRLSWLASKGGAGVCDNVTIEDCAIAGTLNGEINPVGFNLRRNWTIRNNVCASLGSVQGKRLIRIWRVDGLTITGNTQLLGASMYIAHTTDCTDIDISGNEIGLGAGQYLALDSPDPGDDPTDGASARWIAPTIVGSSTAKGAATTLSCNVPSGSAAGDMLFAHVVTRGASWLGLIPEGWTTVIAFEYPDNPGFDSIAVLRRVLTAAEITAGSFTFNFIASGNNGRNVCEMVTVRGYGDEEPQYALGGINTPGYFTPMPEATTYTPSSLVMWFVGNRDGNGSFLADQEDSPIVVQVGSGSSSGICAAVAAKVYTGIGTGQTRSMTCIGSSTPHFVTVAVRGFGPATICLINPG